MAPRVLFALEEGGSAYEVATREQGYFEREYGIPGPLLVDGDLRLLESNAILRHLGRAHFPSLMPTALEELARLDQWLDFFALRLGSAAVRVMALKSAPPPLQDASQLAREVEVVRRLLSILDRGVEGRETLLSRFTIVDCGAISAARVVRALGVGDGYDSLCGYLDRLRARPAWSRAMARLGPA